MRRTRFFDYTSKKIWDAEVTTCAMESRPVLAGGDSLNIFERWNPFLANDINKVKGVNEVNINVRGPEAQDIIRRTLRQTRSQYQDN